MGIDTLTPSVSGAFASDFGDDIVHPNEATSHPNEGTLRHPHPLPKNQPQSQSTSTHRRASSHTFTVKDGTSSATRTRSTNPRQHTYQRSNSFNFPMPFSTPFSMSSPPPLSPSAIDGHAKLFGHMSRRRDSRKSARTPQAQKDHERQVLEELRGIRETQQQMNECMVALQRSHAHIKGDLHHLRLNIEGLQMAATKSGSATAQGAGSAPVSQVQAQVKDKVSLATDSMVAAAAALSMQSVEAPHEISDVFERNIDRFMRMLKGQQSERERLQRERERFLSKVQSLEAKMEELCVAHSHSHSHEQHKPKSTSLPVFRR